MRSLASDIDFVNGSQVQLSVAGTSSGDIINPVWTSYKSDGTVGSTLSITVTISAGDSLTYANGIATLNGDPVPVTGTLSAYQNGQICVSGSSIIPVTSYIYQMDNSSTALDDNITRTVQNVNASNINTGTLSAERIGAQSIDASKIVAGSITSESGVIGTLDAGAITTGTLSSQRIAAGSLNANVIEAGTITSQQISAGTITGTLIAADTITGNNILASSITSAEIAAKTITSNNIASNSITAGNIAAGTITSASGVIGSLDASVITSGTISAARLDLSGCATFSSLSSVSTVANSANATAIAAISSVSSLSSGLSGGTTTINGGCITSGSIQSNNYISNSSGTKISLLDGTIDTAYFKVSSIGKLTATSGVIGGWTLSSVSGGYSLYSNYAGMSSTSDGNGYYAFWCGSGSNSNPGNKSYGTVASGGLTYSVDTFGNMVARSLDVRVSGSSATAISLSATGQMTCNGTTYPQICGNGSALQLAYTNNSASGIVLAPSTLHPAGDGSDTLGSSNHRWAQIYSSVSTISTSDRTEKNTITSLEETKAINFIMALNPVSYKFNDGTSGRTHYGMISQDVEDEMTALGMTSLDFAGLIKSPKTKQVTATDADGNEVFTDEIVEGEYIYGLRYDEFIAPLIKVAQYLNEREQAAENRIATLEAQLTAIQVQMAQVISEASA